MMAKLDNRLLSELGLILSGPKISIFSLLYKDLKVIFKELGFTEEELIPRDIEYFKGLHLPQDTIKLNYERYEIGRRGTLFIPIEKIKLVKEKVKEKSSRNKYSKSFYNSNSPTKTPVILVNSSYDKHVSIPFRLNTFSYNI